MIQKTQPIAENLMFSGADHQGFFNPNIHLGAIAQAFARLKQSENYLVKVQIEKENESIFSKLLFLSQKMAQIDKTLRDVVDDKTLFSKAQCEALKSENAALTDFDKAVKEQLQEFTKASQLALEKKLKEQSANKVLSYFLNDNIKLSAVKEIAEENFSELKEKMPKKEKSVIEPNPNSHIKPNYFSLVEMEGARISFV